MKSDKRNTWVKRGVVGTFVSVPFISSIMSTIHLISLFNLGNVTLMSLSLAIAFELGSIAAFLVPAVLPQIKKGLVYTIFFILAFMQIIGNVFSSYDFIWDKLKVDPHWLDSFMSFISHFGYFESGEVSLYLAMLIGVPIPLIALFFLKSWMDYLRIEKVDESAEIKEKEEKVETKESVIKKDIPENPQPIRIMSDTQVPESRIVADEKILPEEPKIGEVDNSTEDSSEIIFEDDPNSPAIQQNNNLK